jgi:hypothetical protein
VAGHHRAEPRRAQAARRTAVPDRVPCHGPARRQPAAAPVLPGPGGRAVVRRDPRCAIHALPGPDDDELAIRARAVEVGQDRAVRAAIIAVVQPSGVGGMIETVTTDPVFEFDIVRVDAARWLDIGQPGTRAVRQTWKAR